MNLGNTIKEGNEMSQQDHEKALIFLRHHLNDGLKIEYLTVKESQELWKNLKERFDHQRTIVLPRARYEWMHLCLQDFKSVSDYNSALFKISSTLILYGEKVTDQDMLKKIFFTFHASNVLLQQQYRERGFKKRGRGQRRNYQQQIGKKHKTSHQQWNFNNEEANEKSSKVFEDKCYRYGVEGHWFRTCRTSKHLVDLYQSSMKENGKIEANLVDSDDPVDITHLDVSDFFAHPDGNIDHFIGGGVLENKE
ncbi:uncharacterized protein [Henckelia pumila]|uniref:uncharacterized protein n=1 Tax=Henckelia pumila TaxID=405737 RepID=UPI003C6E5CD3